MERRLFPFFIDIHGKSILVIGAGEVALRRVRGLLEFGAVVRVAAPVLHDAFAVLRRRYGDRLQLEERRFQPGEIEGYFFVLSCTDDAAVETMVYEECKKKGIPVNLASDQSRCDFQFPALILTDELVIGVNSGGKNHRLVREIAGKIRKLLGKQEDADDTYRQPGESAGSDSN